MTASGRSSRSGSLSAVGVGDVEFGVAERRAPRGRRCPRPAARRGPAFPAAPVTSTFISTISISERSPTSRRSVFGSPSLRVTLTSRPSRLASMRVPRSSTAEPERRIECSTSERRDDDVLADRGVGADVGVLDAGAGADHGRAADDRAARAIAPSSTTPGPRPCESSIVALEPGLDLLEHEPVGLEHVGELAGVLPPAASRPRTGPRGRLSISAWIASVISSSPRAGGLERPAAVEDRRARRGRRRPGPGPRAGPPASRPGRTTRSAVELGDAVGAGIVDRGEQDQRLRLVCAEGLDQAGDAVAQQVVAEVHHERRSAEELLGGEHRVGEPGRLVLLDVGDLAPRSAEPSPTASRISSPVSGAMMIPISVTPASTRASIP